jgi:hypothetical protein
MIKTLMLIANMIPKTSHLSFAACPGTTMSRPRRLRMIWRRNWTCNAQNKAKKVRWAPKTQVKRHTDAEVEAEAMADVSGRKEEISIKHRLALGLCIVVETPMPEHQAPYC